MIRESIQLLAVVCLVGVLGLSAAYGGQIYGSISEGGKGVKGVKVTIYSPGTPSILTDEFGTYRLYVPEQGKFRMVVEMGGQIPTLDIYSYEKSVRYDLMLEKKGAAYILRRR